MEAENEENMQQPLDSLGFCFYSSMASQEEEALPEGKRHPGPLAHSQGRAVSKEKEFHL